ncbi:protein translocase subunit SecF [Aquipuribacter hungaricus]|uniref:Protein-export membrane protein SecF n=1 Tax=Aquipuribacter hungaricus TaxID=545624 RepID=A0ABV7WCC3_9MICO
MNIDQWGNRLYTGERSYDFVGRRRTWYAIAGAVILVSLLALLLRGFNLGIDFTGGAEFRVAGVQGEVSTIEGEEAVQEVLGESEVQAAVVGGDTLRIRTGEVSTEQSGEVAANLAEAYDVETSDVSASFIGPQWGQDVSQRSLQALVVFLVLVGVVISLYFRTWKMAVAALVALLHDVVITVGLYALIGLEVTPATVIGFLTILGYSLYDTVVVFDKVRENTEEALDTQASTYAEAANLAVNQTLVRSINTSIVALLPVGAILVVSALLLGVGTLVDLSLALFIGIAFGTYSSIFIATPLLVQLREREPGIKALEKKVLAARADRPVRSGGGSGRAGRTATAGGTGGSRSGSSVLVADAPGHDGDVPEGTDDDLLYDRSTLAERQVKRVQPKRPPRSRR